MSSPLRTFPSNAGIAIGPILFVIALLAIIGTVIAAGTSDFGTASTTDRIAADIATQANLIRAKINECNMMYGTNANFDGFPSSGGVAVLVSSLSCSGDPTGLQNLWSGSRVAQLPPPTPGFGPWNYINTNTTGLGGDAVGGRCIWIQPTVSNPKGNNGIVSGLTKAVAKFANGTTFNTSNEVIYDPTSTSQKFVLWITLPTGTPDSNCLP